jgi:phosphate starvation-inducible PhoH-like protein
MEDTESLKSIEARIELPDKWSQDLFYANSDSVIHDIEKKTGLYIAGRDSRLTLRGNERGIQEGTRIIENIISLGRKKKRVSQRDVLYIINKIKTDIDFDISDLQEKTLSLSPNGKEISPKSTGQAAYFDAIQQNDIIFAIGPAGTGKTYIAMAFALHYLLSENISRVILTRPVVEAGESLGYLPGDLEQKVNPYLRPLYDAIYDMIPYESFRRYVERGAIEVAPLAYMRGRTLHDAFIILDEAQNTTKGQMLMFLTRLGFNSKTIVTGDITQIDLPKTKVSGLIAASRLLRKINRISFLNLGPEDVVRHPLVEEVIKAFEKGEQDRKS